MVNLKASLEKGGLLLIVSPVVWTAVPMVGIHLLQAACRQAGTTTSVLYTNLLYCSLVGVELHTAISMEEYFFMKERLFTAAAFDLPPLGHRFHQYFQAGFLPDHIGPKNKKLPGKLTPEIFSPFKDRFSTIDWLHLETRTREWTQSLVQQIAGMGYGMVGCSTTHGGLAPAVALLDGVKKVAPDITTILGGALCEDEMARGILSLKTDIDYIFSGEGETTFPVLAKKILVGDFPVGKIIGGEALTDLDASPLPDYTEYFEQKKHFLLPASRQNSKYIPYETSRGCWYGKCTFCGQKGSKSLYRKKSPDHIIRELKQLVDNCGISNIYITDNTIPPLHFKTLFPRLAAEIPSSRFLYQLRGNLTFDQLLTLREAGATLIQPGIESLGPSLLRRMDKGVTLREHMAMLRYARSLNLDLKWNLLFGIPGEQNSEYEEMLLLFPLIRHLQPPDKMMPLSLCRFSRYQASPGAFGISNLRPAQVHQDVLPGCAHLDKLATRFTGEYSAASFENPGLLSKLYKEYKTWCNQWVSYRIFPLNPLLPVLHIGRKSPDGFILQDTRGIPGRPEKLILDEEQASLVLKTRPWDHSPGSQWAVDAKLGIRMDSWLIPLATAEPALLQEFEP
jgi:ribosomal peptide maturation radical SAM protein 1